MFKRFAIFGVSLCQLVVIMIVMMGNAQAVVTPAGYDLYVRDKFISVNAKVADPAASINAALKYLAARPDKTTWWTIKFEGGRYNLTRPLMADNLQYVSLRSDLSNPAILVKPVNTSYEYMLYCRYCKNFAVKGFQFYGKTKVYDPAIETNVKHPNWGDQGLLFGSSDRIWIENNRFHDFGNAAVRIQTWDYDPVKGVNSFNSTLRNNLFQNVFQVTTTSNSDDHGGSANYLFENNTAVNLHGSIKFATRTAGGANVRIRRNSILGSTLDGFEIVSYNNVEMSGNRLENIARNAVNCYTNERVTMGGFNWGNNFSFLGNVINGANTGIRMSLGAYSDGYVPKPVNLSVTGNAISNLRGANPVVSVTGGGVKGVTVSRNAISKVAARRVFSLGASTDVVMSGNTLDGKSI